MTSLARLAGQEMLDETYGPLRFRVGIDVGPCVAINSGRSDEREPMFIGPAANYAAKLVQDDEEGVFLSKNVRQVLGLAMHESRGSMPRATETDLTRVRLAGGPTSDVAGLNRSRLDEWRREGRDSTILRPADFTFHQHTPPLRSIKYDELSPGNSIRMPLVSIFADLDRYTAYIDHCMANNCISDAVRLLHILRTELNAVLQVDFNGRKVRFIGDCIHGVLADGSSREVDAAESIKSAVLCAGGLRSSFDLARKLVPDADRLGLAIGLEFGATPISRIGIRGERSVRVASSIAVRRSQGVQELCGGDETLIGPDAYAAAPAPIRQLFGPGRKAHALGHEDVRVQLDPGRSAGSGNRSAFILASPVAAASTPARAYVGK